jgi:anthranilate phosphoribosyltransferase
MHNNLFRIALLVTAIAMMLAARGAPIATHCHRGAFYRN